VIDSICQGAAGSTAKQFIASARSSFVATGLSAIYSSAARFSSVSTSGGILSEKKAFMKLL
jgi:hypothetical protein